MHVATTAAISGWFFFFFFFFSSKRIVLLKKETRWFSIGWLDDWGLVETEKVGRCLAEIGRGRVEGVLGGWDQIVHEQFTYHCLFLLVPRGLLFEI